MEDYTAALKIKENADGLCNRAYAFLQLGRHADALADCDKALRLDPDHLHARINLGQAYLNLGQPEEAVREFSRVIAKSPAAAYAYLGRGAAYLALEKKKMAEEDLTLALKLLPQGDPQVDLVMSLLAKARDEAGGEAGGDAPPRLAQRVRGPSPEEGPQQVSRLSRGEARRLFREWKRTEPEQPRFESLVEQFAHSEFSVPKSALADFKNTLRSSSHGQSALKILRAQLRLPEDASPSDVRRNWRSYLAVFQTLRRRFPDDGRTLLESPNTVRANTRAVGHNIELLPDGLLRVSPLPDEIQGQRYSLTVRLYLPEGSEGGHSVTIVASRATSSWEVTAQNAKWESRPNWVVRTTTGVHTVAIVRGWNAIEFTTWVAGDSRTRSVRIRANESLLLAEGELDGLLEGIEIRAGSTPIVVGGLSFRRNW